MWQKLSQTAFLLLLNNFSNAALAFALSVLIGRGLGPAALGHYAAVMAWIFPLSIAAEAGLNTYINRYLSQNRAASPATITLAVRSRLWLGGGMALALWILAPYLSADPVISEGLRWAAPMIWIDSTFGIYTAAWRAWERIPPILALNLAWLSSQVMGGGVIIGAGGGVIEILAWVMFTDLAQLGLAALWWHRSWPGLAPDGPPGPAPAESVRALLKQTWPLAAGVVLLALQSRLAFLWLQTWGPAEAVAALAVASRFIEAAKMPSFALFGASFTQLAKLHQDRGAFVRLERRLAGLLSFYALLIFGALAILGPSLITLSFGPEFAAATPPLLILGLGLWPALLRQNWFHARYAEGGEGWVNRVLLLSFLGQVVLGFLLIPGQATAIRAAQVLLAGEVLGLGLCYVKIIPPLSSEH